jgi:hypothetical protein
MDASQYMRRLAASCPKVIGRTKCVDASLQTQRVGLRAMTTYVSPNDKNTLTTLACCTSSPAHGVGDTTPIKPPAGCVQACETYTDPIILPGCPFDRPSATYVSTRCIPCYKGTPAQEAEAEKGVVNRVLRDCCQSAE